MSFHLVPHWPSLDTYGATLAKVGHLVPHWPRLDMSLDMEVGHGVAKFFYVRMKN